MAAGEGCCGALACSVGTRHKIVEESLVPTWYGQGLSMGGEIIVYIRKYTMGNLIYSCCQIVILRSRHWQEDEDDVIDEKCGEDDKRDALELLTATEEIEERYQEDQRIIRSIAHVHQFAENGTREGLGEQQGRLTAEELLLPRGEDVVKVGEDAIDLIRVRIPPRQ